LLGEKREQRFGSGLGVRLQRLWGGQKKEQNRGPTQEKKKKKKAKKEECQKKVK